MKIDTQFLEDHQARLTVEFEPEVLTAAKRRSAQQLAKKYKIPGFRPGKAPYHVIERFVGEESILEGAIELIVKDNYPKVLEESGIKPYGPGSFENVKGFEPPTFEFVVPLEAKVTLGDYRALRFPYELPGITDNDVSKVLDDLRDRQAVIEPVDRPVQSGDEVHLKLSAQRKKVEEGQNPALIEERDQTNVILKDGDDTKDEWPFPGFSQLLIGAVVGDEKNQDYTYPEDYTYENLRSVEAEFHATVKEIKSRTLPELNDEFAKSVSEFDTLAALQTRVRESLEENNLSQYNASYYEKIMMELLNQSTVKFPPQMLDREVEAMADEIAVRLEQRGLSLETYLKSRQMDEAAFRAETRPSAETRLKRSLILMEVGRKEKIEVKPDEVQMQTAETLKQMGRNLPEKEVRKLSNSDFIYQLVGNITADLFSQKTVELLRTIAKGEAPEPQPEAAQPKEATPAEVNDTAEISGDGNPVAAPVAENAPAEPASPGSENPA